MFLTKQQRERDCRPNWQHIRVWDVFSPVTGDWEEQSTTLCSPVSQDLGMEGTKKPRETVLIKGTWVHLEPLNHISLFPSQLWNQRRNKRQTNGALLLIKLVRNCALGVQPPRTVWNSSYSHSQPCYSRGSGTCRQGADQNAPPVGGQRWENGSWTCSGLVPNSPSMLDTPPPRRRGECWGEGWGHRVEEA